jgi:hypothetical protein
MKRVLFVLLGLFITNVTRTQNPNVQDGPVWRQFSYRIKPGQQAAFWQDFRDNGKPIFELAKKEGTLVDYKLFVNAFKTKPDEWDVMLVMLLPNYAMLDQLEARIVAIYHKHYGSPAATAAAVKKRDEYREIIGDKIVREVILK